MARVNLSTAKDVLTVNGQYDQSTEIFALDGDDVILLLSPTYGVNGGPGNDTLESRIESGIPPDYAVQLQYYDSMGNVEVDLKNGTAKDGWGTVDTIKGFYSVHVGSLNEQVIVLGSERSEYLYVGGSARDPQSTKQYVYFNGGGGNDIIRLGNIELQKFSNFSDFLVYYDGVNNVVIETPSQTVAIQFAYGGSENVKVQLVTVDPNDRSEIKTLSLRELMNLASTKWGASNYNDTIIIDSDFQRAKIMGGNGNDHITLNGLTQGVISEPGNDVFINNIDDPSVTLWFQVGNPAGEFIPPSTIKNTYVNLQTGITQDEWGYVDKISGFKSVHLSDIPRASVIGDLEDNFLWVGGGNGGGKIDFFGGAGFDRITISNGGIHRWVNSGKQLIFQGNNKGHDGVFGYIEIVYGSQSVLIGDDVESILLPQMTGDLKEYSYKELSMMATQATSTENQWLRVIEMSSVEGSKTLGDIQLKLFDIRVEGPQKARLILNDSEVVIMGSSRLKFSDATIALDTDGVAGQAYRIYKAAFNRTPDSEGLGYWIANMDAGLSVVEVSARFIDSAEFRSLYGSNPSNADFLTKVYSNVLGRAPDPSGYAWWLNEMNTNPARTKAKVLADFAESPENISGTSQAISNGISFAAYSGPTITPTPPEPTYTLSSVASANEGDTIVFTVLGENAAAGTSLPYTLSGISAQDLSSGSLTGNLVLDGSAKATLSVTFANDQITEGTETLTLTVAGKTQSVSIQDTSTTPPAPPANPTYSLSVNQTTANEGDTLIFTLNTQNVPQGTVLQYEVTGVSGTDVVGAQLFGQVLVPNTGQARFSITLAQDDSTEGNETLRLSIANQFAEILIRDTSTGVVGQPGGGTDDGGGGGGGGGG